MLKAKLKSSNNRHKEAALREVMKEDNDKVIFARVTSKEMKKLLIDLAGRDMTIVEWVKEKIEEI